MRKLRLLIIAAAVGVGAFGGADTASAVCWSNADCTTTTWAINATAPGTAHHTWWRLGISNGTGYNLNGNLWNNASEGGYGNTCVSNGYISYTGGITWWNCTYFRLGYAHGNQTTRTTASLHGNGSF